MQPLDHAGAPRFDGAAALSFLQALGAEPSAVHYRAIHWDKNHEPKGERAVHLAPTFQPRGARLEQLQQAGYRLYWLPNGGPNDADVKACSFLFVEWDEQPMEWQVGAWQALGLPEPTVLLATGGKSIHAYWRLSEPIAPERWRPLIQRLIAYCKSDPTCKNPSRLMRLAGSSYIHKSDDLGPDGQSIGGTLGAHPARMIRHSPAAIYSADVFEERLPELPKPEPPAPAPAPSAPARSAAADQPRTYEELERLVSSYPQIMAKNGQREEALRLVCGLARCMELIGKGKLDAITLASRYHPQAADTFEQVDRWKFDQFDAGSFIKQCKGAGVDVKRHDIPKPPPPTPPLNGEQFIPADAPVELPPWQLEPDEEGDDIERQELAVEIRNYRDVAAAAELASIDLAFPPGLASLVNTYASEQMLKPCGFLLPILCSVCSVIGNRARVAMTPTHAWKEACVLWGANIATASSGKSPTSGPTTMQAFKPWQAQERKRHADALADWKHRRARAEREAKAAASESGGAGGDPMAQFLAENPQPELRHLLVSDATFERIEMILSNGSNPGLLAVHDELAGWFSQLCRAPNRSDRAKWLSLYPGEQIITDRVGRDSIFVPNPAVSLFGSLQPARLEGLWKADADANEGMADADGLWSRFLMFDLGEWAYDYQDSTVLIAPAITNLYKQVDAAASKLPLGEDGEPIIITVAEDAKATMVQWVRQAESFKFAASDPSDRQYWGKQRGATLRIALAIHAIRQASAGLSLNTPIPEDVIRAAIIFTALFARERDKVLGPVRTVAGGAIKRLLDKGREWRRSHGSRPVPQSQVRAWCLPARRTPAAEVRTWLLSVVAETPDCGQVVRKGKAVEWVPPGD